MSKDSETKLSGEKGPQADHFLFIDAQDVIQLNFLMTDTKEGRFDYKVDTDQFLPLGKQWRKIFKEFSKLGVKIVLLEYMKKIPSDKSHISDSPLDKILKRWHVEGVCPEIAAKVIYTDSNPQDSLEWEGEEKTFLYRLKGLITYELSTFCEEKLGIEEECRGQHFVITSLKNKNIHPKYQHITAQDWCKRKKQLVDIKEWNAPRFFLALKSIYLQITESKVFERLTKFGLIYADSDLKFVQDLGKEKELIKLIDGLYDQMTSGVAPGPDSFKCLRELAKDIKEGEFNNKLVGDLDPNFQIPTRFPGKNKNEIIKNYNEKIKKIDEFVEMIDKFIPTYRVRFNEQLEKLDIKRKELIQRGFQHAVEGLEGCCQNLHKRFDWFCTLYTYEKSSYIRLYGLLDCIEDCEKIVEQAKNGVLKEHRGWLNILCNILAFFAATVTVIPMVVYCCYYANRKKYDQNYSFFLQLKTDSLKLLEQTEDVIRVPELSKG